MEQDEALHVLIERATPEHRRGDAAESVVQNRDVAGLFGYRCAVAHRKTHLGGVQGRGIVGSVSGHGHHLAVLLQGFDQAFLVHRTGAGDDFELPYPLLEFLVAQFGELRAGNPVFFGVFRFPQMHLAGNFGRCGWRIAGNDFDVDAGIDAFLDGGRHIGAYRVGDAYEAHELERQARFEAAVFKAAFVAFRIQFGKGEAQGTHGFALIAEKLVIDVFFPIGHGLVLSVHTDALAEVEQDFRRAFDIEHAAVGEQERVDHGGHVFALGGECELLFDTGRFPDAGIVFALVAEPEQQGSFGGVADYFGLVDIGFVQESRGVGRDAFLDEAAGIVHAQVQGFLAFVPLD